MSNTASTITVIVAVSGVTIGAVYAMAAQLGKRIDDLRDDLRAGFDRVERRLERIEGKVLDDHESRISRLEGAQT